MFADKNANGIVDVPNSASTNDILQENHYYPFGLGYEGGWLMNDAARDNKYQYNGKELNDDFGLNWYDYGARYYMPDIGRWGQIDLMAEKYAPLSTYNYSFNSPIRFFDPDGSDPGDVLVAFGGADSFSKGNVGATKGIVDNLRDTYFKEKGGSAKAFVSQYWTRETYNGQYGPVSGLTNTLENLDAVTQDAYEYVLKNYSEGGRVILFGYSYGGVLATHLEERLKDAGIKVDLLVTVDAAAGPDNEKVDRTISNNTEENLNIYQPNTSPVGSRGNRNTREDGTERGITNKIKVTYKDEKGETKKMSHSAVFGESTKEVIQKILETLNNKK